MSMKWLYGFALLFVALSAYGQQSHSEEDIEGVWHSIGYISGAEFIGTGSMSMEDAEYLLVNSEGHCQVYAKGIMNDKPSVVYSYFYMFSEKEKKIYYAMTYPVTSTEAFEFIFIDNDLIVMQFGDFSYPYVFQRETLIPIED